MSARDALTRVLRTHGFHATHAEQVADVVLSEWLPLLACDKLAVERQAHLLYDKAMQDRGHPDFEWADCPMEFRKSWRDRARQNISALADSLQTTDVEAAS